MTVALLGRSLIEAPRHPLHAHERTWTETNCYVDLWVEVLHALGLDPVPAGVGALSAGFQGDQWDFLKVAPEDLRVLYGIRVEEINVWRPVLDHVVEQLRRGCLLTVEVDAFWLPDTAGVGYRETHSKTTIVPHLVDLETPALEYWHNAGHFRLDGEDFAGVLDQPPVSRFGSLPPYVELVDLRGLAQRDDLAAITAASARDHVRRRAPGNPVAELGDRLAADLPWLATQPLEVFHAYAFGMLRQCGVTAQVGADVLRWLADHGQDGLLPAAQALDEVSEGMKVLQLRAARAARGRALDAEAAVQPLASAWERADADLRSWAGA